MMLKRQKLLSLDDFLKPIAQRPAPGVYFCRIAGYSAAVAALLEQAAAFRTKVPTLFLDQLQNPDEKQLAYFREIMGMDFALDAGFLDRALRKWLPRLNDVQRSSLVRSLMQTLQGQRAQGKTDNMLRNAYIKFMCWMYYRFEQILHKLGQEPLPRIFYDGVLSAHELQLFCVLGDAGCDIALLEPHGDDTYQKLDPHSAYAALYAEGTAAPFPAGFSLTAFVRKAGERQQMVSLYGGDDLPVAATNTWLSGDLLADALKRSTERGNDNRCFCNMFVRIRGVEDKAAYVQQLFRWQNQLKEQGRKVTVLESIPVPTPGEVSPLSGCSMQSAQRMIMTLLPALKSTASKQLDGIARRAFSELLLAEAAQDGDRLNRLKNKAIYLVCWYNRYMPMVFDRWSMEALPVFVYFGTCGTAFEALFLRFLSRLPLDVLEITPVGGAACTLDDPKLFSRESPGSLTLAHFPDSPDDAAIGTVAFHAEQELTEVLYQDSGMYRTQQYTKATAVTLQTMYEEIFLLWDQEMPIRPGFEIIGGDTVLTPVVTAKVSGVKNRDVTAYWNDVRKLAGENTYYIRSCPHFDPGTVDAGFNPVPMIKNRKLQRQKIRENTAYAYGLLREEVQVFILDKIQQLLDSDLIKGTFAQGMEYKILSVALHLDKELVRMIQRYDFTKQAPKVVLACTDERGCSLEDGILLALLHFMGFDEVLFVPTGYQIVERYYSQPLFVEHQAGEYLYDLTAPYLSSGTTAQQGGGLFTRIFRRG